MYFSSTITLQNISETIKDGDCLAMYSNKWYAVFAKGIKYFTGGIPSHVGMVSSVRKTKKYIEFNFIETNVKNGGICKVCYIDIKNGVYTLSGIHSDGVDLYYLELNKNLKKSQKDLLVNFGVSINGKPYKLNKLWLPLLGAINKNILHIFKAWFEKPLIFKMPSFAKSIPFCSGLTWRGLYECEIISRDEYLKNPYPTPRQFCNSGYFTISKIK